MSRVLRELHDASGPSENPKLIKVQTLCDYALLHSKLRDDAVEMVKQVERRVARRALKHSNEFDLEMASRWSRQEAAPAAKRQRQLAQTALDLYVSLGFECAKDST